MRLNNKGMTMTEVIVGFVVLMLFVGGLSGIIKASSHMVMNSIDVKRSEEKLEAELYKTSSSDREIVKNGVKIINQETASEISFTDVEMYKLESDKIDGVDEGFDVTVYGFQKKTE